MDIHVIIHIIGKEKNTHNSSTFTINGNPTFDKSVISNSFNIYFTRLGPLLAQNIQSHINFLNSLIDTIKTMSIPYISEYEITEIIKSLKNSSAGWDYISVSIAKQCTKHYIKPLNFFWMWYFPNELKLVKDVVVRLSVWPISV